MYNTRERVLAVECWSMEPDARGSNQGTMSDPIRLKPHVSIMTEHHTLVESWSPYKHNRIPYVPLWAYREKSTGLPYSPVRRLMDKQVALNKAMSKAIHEINTDQVAMEDGAYNAEIMTLDDLRAEINDPEGMPIFAKGALSGAKVQFRKGIEDAKSHLGLADRIAQSMVESSNVPREARGQDSNTLSGIAMSRKTDMGGVLTTELFDNLLLYDQIMGDLLLSVTEQFMVGPTVVPATGERGKLDMLAINQPDPATGRILNDITARSARYVVGDQPWRATLGQAMFESLLDLLAKLAPMAPQVVTAMLDLVFEYADLPNKETMLERIRKITGQTGPDNKLTPEQQAAQQQQAELANAQFQAQMATLQAQVREAQAKGAKLDAEAIGKSLESIYTAAQAAQVAQMNPGVAPMADELLKSVGFVDQHPGAAPMTPPPAGAMPGPIPPPQGALVGHEAGIETPAADGVPQGVM
jgi:hypothetical protein